MKKIITLLLALVVAYLGYQRQQPATGNLDNNPGIAASSVGNTEAVSSDDALIAEAYRSQRSNVLSTVSGTVSKVLSDDNQGSRHQRFILQLGSGQTVLVAHNIDLAGRVENLRAGDVITVRGEYEWNNKGGVLHWTHHDPSQRHVAGWIKHQGQTYQ
jgi:hypothetical protein